MAAIVSLILSVRMRIQLVGSSDVPKDPFDFENFMIAIGQFQRQYKLDKTKARYGNIEQAIHCNKRQVVATKEH